MLDASENEVRLAGRLACAPKRERDDKGAPVTVLTFAFQRPEGRYATELWGPAIYEVDVPEVLAAELTATLDTGSRLAVVGKLAGGGRVRADSLGPVSASASTLGVGDE